MSTIDLAAARILRLREANGARTPGRAATGRVPGASVAVPRPVGAKTAADGAETAADGTETRADRAETVAAVQATRAAWPARALAAWRRRRRIAAGVVALRELDDRMLADLGLERGGIERAARRGRD
jgi:uncharacterized protein YjiS (DUF1127 family)